MTCQRNDSVRLQALFHEALPVAKRTAGVRFSSFAGTFRPAGVDREDITQEAFLALWQALSYYEPERAAIPTFIEGVVTNRVTSVARGIHAHRRGFGRTRPLDTVDILLASPDYAPDLGVAIRQVLARVLPFDRTVALSLAAYSVADTGRRLGVCRASVYRSIGRLRAAFVVAGYGRIAVKQIRTPPPDQVLPSAATTRDEALATLALSAATARVSARPARAKRTQHLPLCTHPITQTTREGGV